MICAEHGGSEKLVSGFVLREGAAKILAEARAAFTTEWMSPAVTDMKAIVVTALTATERQMVDLRGFQIGPRSPLNVKPLFVPYHVVRMLDSFVWVTWCDQDNFSLTNFLSFFVFFSFVVVDPEPVAP